MTVRTAAAIGSLAVLVASAGCLKVVEIPVEVPIQAKIDVTDFRRVLVAGFVTGGTSSIDPNTETARLLKSQLRSKQEMRVIDADVISLVDEVDKRRTDAGAPAISGPSARPEDSQPTATQGPAQAQTAQIKDERDLAAYEGIFSDEAYWKKVGEEYDSPLIVTGSVLFTEVSKSGMVSRPTSYVNDGVEQYRTERVYTDLKGYALSPTFIFIDGRTGKLLAREPYHEETLYPAGQNTPPLSSYFELMDKLLPSFLNTLSSQKIRGSRVLLK
jgi:hypothetical protein